MRNVFHKLDKHSNYGVGLYPIGWWSVTNRKPGYNGPAIRVRRLVDNTECDIPFTEDGELSEQALLDFLVYDAAANEAILGTATTSVMGQVYNGEQLYDVVSTGWDRSVSSGVIAHYTCDNSVEEQIIDILQSTSGYGCSMTNFFNIVEGGSLSIYVDQRVHGANTVKNQMSITWFSGDVQISTVSTSYYTSLANTRISLLNQVAPAGTTRFRIVLKVVPTAAGNIGTSYFSNLQLVMNNDTLFVSQVYNQIRGDTYLYQDNYALQPVIYKDGAIVRNSSGKPSIHLNGTKCFKVASNDKLNITRDTIGISAEFEPEIHSTGIGTIISRNADTIQSTQFGLYSDSNASNIKYYIDGYEYTSNYASKVKALLDRRYLIFYDNAGGNLVKIRQEVCMSDNFTTRANMLVGARSNATDGATHTDFFTGYINDIRIYNYNIAKGIIFQEHIDITYNTFYVDFDNGNDSNNGSAPETPWKHAPDDPNATGVAYSHALKAGEIVLFKGGVTYRGDLRLKNSGNITGRIIYRGVGWGDEPAIISGADPLNVTWTQCTSADQVNGNPNYSHIYYANIPPTDFFNTLYQGDDTYYFSQYPIMPDPFSFNDTTYFISRRLPDSRYAITLTTIRDDEYFVQPEGYWDNSFVVIWVSPNICVTQKITAYNPTTHTITFEEITGNTLYTNVLTYSMINNAALIDSVGKYFYNTATNIVYMWAYDPTFTTPITIAKRTRGFSINGKSHVTIEGFKIKEYIGPIGASHNGVAFYSLNNTIQNVTIQNNEIYNIRSMEGAAVIDFTYGDNVKIINNYIHDVQKASGIAVILQNSIVGGNRINKTGRSGIRTLGTTTYPSLNTQIIDNYITNIYDIHGNGITVYDNNINCLVARNKVIGASRPMTMHGYDTPETNHNVIVYGNLLVADGIDAVAALTDWGAQFNNVKILNNTLISTFDIALGLHYDAANVVVKNNIVQGGMAITRIGNSNPALDCRSLAAKGWEFSNNIYTGLSWMQSDARYNWMAGPNEIIDTNLSNIFIDFDNRNFELKSGSTAINSGTDITGYIGTGFNEFDINLDLIKGERNFGGYWDVGCYEYAGIDLQGISLNHSTLDLSTGITGQLDVIFNPPDATNKQITYTSSDPNVATVDNNGLVTPVGGGTTTITVTSAEGGFTATCNVSVTAYILISNSTELSNLRNDFTKRYRLVNDIDLSEIANWSSFTDAVGNLFTGELDGNGHKITNLTITGTGNGRGLFGIVSGVGGTIKNLGLKNVNISGGTYVGGLVGWAKGNINIYQCSVTGQIHAISNQVGGLVGYNASNGSITDCYNRASITGVGTEGIGGIVGRNGTGILTRCYNSGVITGNTGYNSGGLIGFGTGGSVVDSYWDTQTSHVTASVDGGTGLTTSLMKSSASYTNWNFTNTWEINTDANDGYPTLRIMPAILWSDYFNKNDCVGITNVGNGWHNAIGTMGADIVSSNLVLRGCNDTYGVIANPANGKLPENYLVIVALPSGPKGSNFGLVARYNPSNNTGVRLLFTDNQTITVGSITGPQDGNISVPTPNFPALWSNDAITHTLGMKLYGETIDIICDGVVVTQVTCNINAAIKNTEVGFCGESDDRVRLSIEVIDI